MKRKDQIQNLRIRDEMRKDPIFTKMLFITVIVYILLLLLYSGFNHYGEIYIIKFITFSDVANFIPSFAELLSVFVGISFGYIWDRSYRRIELQKENMKIFYELISELEGNKEKLRDIYKSQGVNNIQFLLKTNVWEIYKESLGRFVTWNVEELTGIYHNLIVINESIQHYPFVTDFPDPSTRKPIKKIKNETIEKIDNWIKEVTDYYKEEVEIT